MFEDVGSCTLLRRPNFYIRKMSVNTVEKKSNEPYLFFKEKINKFAFELLKSRECNPGPFLQNRDSGFDSVLVPGKPGFSGLEIKMEIIYF